MIKDPRKGAPLASFVLRVTGRPAIVRYELHDLRTGTKRRFTRADSLAAFLREQGWRSRRRARQRRRARAIRAEAAASRAGRPWRPGSPRTSRRLAMVEDGCRMAPRRTSPGRGPVYATIPRAAIADAGGISRPPAAGIDRLR
jgi:hypothetical protein